MKFVVRNLIPVVAIVLLSATIASACPSCKEGLEQGQANMIQGYFWSIMFMMSMPFVIFGGLSTYFYLEVRRARAQKAAAQSAPLPSLPAGHEAVGA